jgi:hypothetical protein
MKYDVITFDTQTVEHNSFHFDGGLLYQLRQFRDGPVKVIISEIVFREILKHLIEKTRQANDSLVTAHKKALDTGLLSSTTTISEETIVNVARGRLLEFLLNIGAEVIRADEVPMKDLVQLYFRPGPPFAAAGKNKSEFPDAIALLSLGKWAKDNDKSIIAASNDKGWAAFASGHERIDVVGDLADALARLQEHKEEATSLVKGLLSSLQDGSAPDLATQFEKLLSDEVSSHSVYAEGNSAYELDSDDVELEMQYYQIAGDLDEPEFELVQIGPKILVARLDVEMSLKASTSFSMSIYDSIDKDYTGLGSTNATVVTDEDFEILVTFQRLTDEPYSISKIEIVRGPTSVDFGDVEPDYEPDYEDDIPLPETAVSKDLDDDLPW